MSSAPPSSAPASAPAPGPASAPKKTEKKRPPKKKAAATKAVGAGTQAKVKKPTKRKKPASKASSAASTQAVLNDARNAQLDLARQRVLAAAKKSDPLWYRIEDVLPSISDGNAMVSKPSVLPEQIQVVEAALKHNGLTRSDVTPQAMACLLEQARRHTLELMTDATDYAYAANRAELSRADLLLAAEMRADFPIAISTQLPKLNLVAQQVNRAPLPPIPSQCFSGVLLPQKEHQLTARTYDIVSGAQLERKMIQEAPPPPSAKNTKSNKSAINQPPGYGASRGRQISVKLKDQPQTSKPLDKSKNSSTETNTGAAAAASSASTTTK